MRVSGLASGLALAVRPAGAGRGLQGQRRAAGASKSLTLVQAEALLAAAENTSLHAYIVLPLLTGALTEELRALTWSYVDLDSDSPFMMVWRSVRAGGDTKTRKSRRRLKLPLCCVDVLRDH